MGGRLTREDAILILIDFQEKLMEHIYMADEVADRAILMIDAAKILGLPILLTEQYPKGLGRTIPKIKEKLGDVNPVEKRHFDCFRVEEFCRRVQEEGRRHLLFAGVETHICILQTSISALERGYHAHILVDATSSRRVMEREVALQRIDGEGGKLATVEMVIFQLLEEAGTREFKEVLTLIK